MEKRMPQSYADNPEIQTPRQYQPAGDIGKRYVFGYAKSIRNTNIAMLNLFNDITILNPDDNTIYPVPIIFGTMEKAVIYAFGEQFVNSDRKDEGLVDRIKIPMAALENTSINFSEKRYIYHESKRKMGYGQEKKPYDVIYEFSKGIPVDMGYRLTVWAKYYEHLMQMVELILQKFSKVAYIKADGIPWETIVQITGTGSNLESEIQDRQERILKYSFEMTAESHIMQPITRTKTVQSIKHKYVLMGDLTPSGEIETITEETAEGDKPNEPN